MRSNAFTNLNGILTNKYVSISNYVLGMGSVYPIACHLWEQEKSGFSEIHAAVQRLTGQVVFYLPKDYDHAPMPRIGKELAQAYGFFRDMFGSLVGDETQVGVSPAGRHEPGGA